MCLCISKQFWVKRKYKIFALNKKLDKTASKGGNGWWGVGRVAQKQNGARNPPGAAQDVPRGVCFLQISKCKFGQVFKFVIHACLQLFEVANKF